MRYKVNTNRDAIMDRSHPVGKIVTFIKITKSGLYYVVDTDGNFYSLPKINKLKK